MPRRPKGRRHCSRPLRFSFSPFGRSMALLHSSGKRVGRMDSISEEKTAPSTSGKGLVKDAPYTDSSDDGEFEGFVQADFAFFDPKPNDFHGVQVLLQAYLDDKEWDLTGFVDLILQQTTVGTVIKIEGDKEEAIYGFISALNLGRYKDQKCILELKEYLSKACNENVSTNLKSLLGDNAHEVGLLVSQRFVNLPPQLLPHLYKGLFEEVLWATEDEITEELQKSFCFKTYMIISKIYKHKKADKKVVERGQGEEDIVYSKLEDEIFHQLCSWSISFPMHGQQVKPDELTDYRPMCLVMAVDASKVPTFEEQLRSLIN